MQVVRLWRCSIVFALAYLGLLFCSLPVLANDWALLIGIDSYKDIRLPQCAGATDVTELSAILCAKHQFSADHIITLTDEAATRTAILTALARLASCRPDDTVFIYFSGHARSLLLPRGGEMGYLLPADAVIAPEEADNVAAYDLAAIGLDALRRNLSRVPARKVLCVIDASLPGQTLLSGRSEHTTVTLSSRQVIFARLAGFPQTKQANSFFAALRRGLDTGAADLNGDQQICGSELYAYLRGEAQRQDAPAPQHLSFGEGDEYRFPVVTKVTPSVATAPRLVFFHGQNELGMDELWLPPVGGTVTVTGVVLSTHPLVEVTVDGKPCQLVPLKDVAASSLCKRPGETTVQQFRLELAVEQDRQRTVTVIARDVTMLEARQRLLLRTGAADIAPPEIVLNGVRVVPSARSDASRGLIVTSRGLLITSRGLLVTSKGLIVTSKGGAIPIEQPGPGECQAVSGFVRDDRGVVDVRVMGTPAFTRPATSQELAARGWSGGVYFEGDLALAPRRAAEVVITADDAAGNRSRQSLTVEPTSTPRTNQAALDIVVLEPRKSAESSATLLPTSLTTLRVAGVARGDSPIVRVEIAGKNAMLQPASPDALRQAGWTTKATAFDVVIPCSAIPEDGITITAVDTNGRSASTFLSLRLNKPLVLTCEADQQSYKISDRLHFRLLVNRDAYVYLLHREPNGGLALLLPNPVEPDCLLRAGVSRVFPAPGEERRWERRYGLVASEPVGADAIYCLATPAPLPPAQLLTLTNLTDFGKLLSLAAGAKGLKLNVPDRVEDADIARCAAELGGAWTIMRYEVKP